MNKKVVLVHGYFRNHKDMMDLKNNLETLGYKGGFVDLPLTFNSIEYAVSVFEEKMDKLINNLKEDEKISLVGHSTGGLVIRLFLSNTIYKDKIHRCVLIATPNKGSRLADIAFKISRVLIHVFKTLKSLRTENILNLNLKNEAPIEIGAIIGNKNNLILGKLLNTENDGRVAVQSAVYDELKDYIIIPYNHVEIHHKLETAKLVHNFLQNGEF